MTVKSRIWWAFLTGTAKEYRELASQPAAQNSYSPISIRSINGPFAPQAVMQVHDTVSENCDFRRCT